MSPARAREVFAAERARFARVFPRAAKTQFVLLARACTDRRHCRFRDLAFAQPEIPRVSMLRRTLQLPDENVVGLMRHELGHVVDRDVERPWREQRADDIAEWVTGEPVRYDRMNIQTVGRGRYPRPMHLHR